METILFYSELFGLLFLSGYIAARMVTHLDLDQLTSDRRLIRLNLSGFVAGLVVMACTLLLVYTAVDWLLDDPYLTISSLTYLANMLSLVAVLPAVWSCIVISHVHRKVKELEAIPL